jgi:hypothetical protein
MTKDEIVVLAQTLDADHDGFVNLTEWKQGLRLAEARAQMRAEAFAEAEAEVAAADAAAAASVAGGGGISGSSSGDSSGGGSDQKPKGKGRRLSMAASAKSMIFRGLQKRGSARSAEKKKTREAKRSASERSASERSPAKRAKEKREEREAEQFENMGGGEEVGAEEEGGEEEQQEEEQQQQQEEEEEEQQQQQQQQEEEEQHEVTDAIYHKHQAVDDDEEDSDSSDEEEEWQRRRRVEAEMQVDKIKGGAGDLVAANGGTQHQQSFLSLHDSPHRRHEAIKIPIAALSKASVAHTSVRRSSADDTSSFVVYGSGTNGGKHPIRVECVRSPMPVRVCSIGREARTPNTSSPASRVSAGGMGGVRWVEASPEASTASRAGQLRNGTVCEVVSTSPDAVLVNVGW